MTKLDVTVGYKLTCAVLGGIDSPSSNEAIDVCIRNASQLVVRRSENL